LTDLAITAFVAFTIGKGVRLLLAKCVAVVTIVVALTVGHSIAHSAVSITFAFVFTRLGNCLAA
jgi:hypothetical protein